MWIKHPTCWRNLLNRKKMDSPVGVQRPRVGGINAMCHVVVTCSIEHENMHFTKLTNFNVLLWQPHHAKFEAGFTSGEW